MRRTPSLLIFLLMQSCSGTSGPGATHGQPQISRDYGYVIGDVIPIDYRFDLKGDQIDPESLPPPGPLNEWLILRSRRIESFHHRDGEETRLRVEYQTFKGIRGPERLEIPALTFRLKAHPETEISTDPWTFTQVPVIPPEDKDENIMPHDGTDIPPIDVEQPSARMGYWFLSLLGTMILMLIRRHLVGRRYRPFHAIQGKIRVLFHEGAGSEALLEGMRLFHRALDQTFGRTLFKRDVPSFIDAHPAYRDVQVELVQFFNLSGQLFFDPTTPTITSSDHQFLIRLLGGCLRAEKISL